MHICIQKLHTTIKMQNHNIISIIFNILYITSAYSSTVRAENQNTPKPVGILFFNTKTNKTLSPPIATTPGRNGEVVRMPRVGLPCSCQNMNCGCCAGITIGQFRFSQQLCTNFTYVPDELGIETDITLNGIPLYHNLLSARNPPPICTPIPNIPFIELCVKLFDIFTKYGNIHVCVDVEARFLMQPVIVLHFDCVHVGQYGIGLVKPGDDSWLEPIESVPVPVQTNWDVFDNVNEVRKKIIG